MGKTYERIDDKLTQYILAQQMFFVASAPLAEDGLVNVSPKGLDTFRILDPLTAAYLDLTGSGIETLSHLKENGRMVIMFCSFTGRPMTLRLHGRGTALETGDAEFEQLLPLFPAQPGIRSIIKLSIQRIADSCGWSVPEYEYKGQRDQLTRYTEQVGTERLREGQLASNMKSLDGLPGLRAPSL